MGGTCSACGIGKKINKNFGCDWIHLASDRDQWRALVDTVLNLRVHKRREIS
jgi:hypothetical protein